MGIEGSCWVIREEGAKRLTATGKRAQGKKMKGGKTMLIRMQKTLEGRQGEGRKASVARTQREKDPVDTASSPHDEPRVEVQGEGEEHALARSRGRGLVGRGHVCAEEEDGSLAEDEPSEGHRG